MAQDLRIYIETDGGVGVSGWTVTRRAARKTGAPGAIQGTTTTDVNGMAEFTSVDPATGPWDIYATNGTAVREWRGYTSPPLAVTDLQVATTANILLTKLDEGTIDDTVDPATTPTTLQARLSQFAALLKALGGGSAFNTPAGSTGRNALVNGPFDVWQRGTSFAAPATLAYLADRWQWQFVGTGVATLARDTSVPTVGANAILADYSLKMTIPTTADAAIAAGDLYRIFQAVEGYDIRSLANGFTLSFWVRAHRTGTYCVAFVNSGANRSWVAEYTVSAADTWEYKTVVVTTPPFGAGTWNFTTGIGLYVSFAVAAGSNFQGTAGSWQSSQVLATSNQVNGVGATSDVFQLALVNLIPGAVAAPLQPVSITDQMQRCQRYCQVFGGADTNEVVGTGLAISSTQAQVLVPFLVTMQGVPTLTVSAAADWSVTGTACTVLALTANATSTHRAGLTGTVAAGLSTGNGATLRAAATSNARLTFEANPA